MSSVIDIFKHKLLICLSYITTLRNRHKSFVAMLPHSASGNWGIARLKSYSPPFLKGLGAGSVCMGGWVGGWGGWGGEQMSRDARKPVFGIYPCSENKGADQLRGYREADLRLCFRLGKNPVFSRCGSNNWSFIIIL